MKPLLTLMLAVLLTVSPLVHGEAGVNRQEFRTANVTLKKCKVGKTVLYYDKSITKKKLNNTKKYIKQLPAKVQKCAKKVYLLNRKNYLKTCNKGLVDTSGYFIVERKEIYICSSSSLRDVIFHEFGHAYDCRKSPFGLSSTKKWKKITRSMMGKKYDYIEYFAEVFADYLDVILEADYNYIHTKL